MVVRAYQHAFLLIVRKYGENVIYLYVFSFEKRESRDRECLCKALNEMNEPVYGKEWKLFSGLLLADYENKKEVDSL